MRGSKEPAWATTALEPIGERPAVSAAPAGPSAPPARTMPRLETSAEPVDLARLYEAHGATVYRWAARLIGPGADVEDVVHDVFLRVERHKAGFRSESSVRTWLYTITKREAFRALRKKRIGSWLGLHESGADALADPKADPFRAFERGEEIRAVYRALDRLRPKDREVLVLHEIEGLTGPQIAELVGVKPSTIWVRLHRAKKRFSKVFDAEGGPR